MKGFTFYCITLAHLSLSFCNSDSF